MVECLKSVWFCERAVTLSVGRWEIRGLYKFPPASRSRLSPSRSPRAGGKRNYGFASKRAAVSEIVPEDDVKCDNMSVNLTSRSDLGLITDLLIS